MKRPAAAQRADPPIKRLQAQEKSRWEKPSISSSGTVKRPAAAHHARAGPTVRPSSDHAMQRLKRPAAAHQVTQGGTVVQKVCKARRQTKAQAVARQSIGPVIFTLFEEARARVEAFLGWAMLLRVNVCCKSFVTLATQRRLAEALQLAWPQPRAPSWIFIARNVLRLFIRHVAPIRGLANVLTSYYSSKPLYRVRVEHIPQWSPPPGRQVHWSRQLRAFFRTGQFAWITGGATIQAPHQCWREVSHRWTRNVLLEVFVTTTARFTWHGFQIELLEQTNEISDLDTETSSES